MKKSSIKTDPKEVIRRIKDAVLMLEITSFACATKIIFDPKNHPLTLFEVTGNNEYYSKVVFFPKDNSFRVETRAQVLLSTSVGIYIAVLSSNNTIANVLTKLKLYYELNMPPTKPIKKRK